MLFLETSSAADIQKIIDDKNADSRVKVPAYNKLLAGGHKPEEKELPVVIV